MDELMAKIRALLPADHVAVVASPGFAFATAGTLGVVDEGVGEVYGRLANAIDHSIAGLADAMRQQDGDERAARFLAEVDRYHKATPALITGDVRSRIIPEGDEDARRR